MRARAGRMAAYPNMQVIAALFRSHLSGQLETLQA